MMKMCHQDLKKVWIVVCILSCAIFAQAQVDESKLTWKPDRGITLNGATEYMIVEDADDFNLDAFTVEAWVNLRDNGGRQQIAGRGSAGQYFTLYADNGDGRFLVEDAEVGHESARTAIFPTDTWVHIAGIYDGAFVQLYYNGILVDETEWAATTRHGEDPLMIGALEPGQRHVNGMLENLRIWNRALTEDELTQALTTKPADENIDQMKSDGLLAYWALRSVQNGTVGDLAGGHDAAMEAYTLDQSNLTFVPQNGISFDGQSTYAKVEDGT
ncbi:hypothetical protein GF373_00485, partial [bacterium]|nr:hypothetical protein [bacterium]